MSTWPNTWVEWLAGVIGIGVLVVLFVVVVLWLADRGAGSTRTQAKKAFEPCTPGPYIYEPPRPVYRMCPLVVHPMQPGYCASRPFAECDTYDGCRAECVPASEARS